MLRIAIPLTTAVMGGYYSNYYRRAGNSTFGNLFSNNRYVSPQPAAFLESSPQSSSSKR